MKLKLFVSFLLLLVVAPASGQLLSDATGLVNRLDVKTGGYTFEVETVANFDIQDFEFDEEEKRLTLYASSSLENNLGEVYLPQTLLSGNFTFYINGEEYFPAIKLNDNISFITLNFTGSGNNKIEIIGTDYLQGLESSIESELPTESQDKGGGCLIATAAYGSELASQVQQLRELRDNSLLQTELGKSFVNSFNDFYYSFSPIVSDYERENPIFKEMVKIAITPMLSTLSIMTLSDGSESGVLGLGISVIVLNMGMYFVAPVIVIVGIRKKF